MGGFSSLVNISRNMSGEPAQEVKQKQTQSEESAKLHRLLRRIRKEFVQKTLLGDILLSDQEYEQVIKYYFTPKSQHILRSGISLRDDPIYAVALVQIGIREYDGKYWPHVAKILGRQALNPHQQSIIGQSFVNTLRMHNKRFLEDREWVNNILLHGFVAERYADQLFEFLFKYYTIDLERDLSRNSSEMMDRLMEITQRDDNSGRTHLLVRQTAHALAVNPRGGKLRLRRLLKLIDKAFWNEDLPENPCSRLTRLLIRWVNESENFRIQWERIRSGRDIHKGSKSFSSPYLYCDLGQNEFYIRLPAQLLREDQTGSLNWNIIVGDHLADRVGTEAYESVTGWKTEEKEWPVSPEKLFEQFEFQFCLDNKPIRTFRIKPDCIRFFDSSGYFIASNNLPQRRVYAFTRRDEIPVSKAWLDSEPVKGLLKTSFEFEVGDYVRLPNGQVLSIGKNLEEGLLGRRRMAGVECVLEQGERIPVYSHPPIILLKMEERKAKGTLIMINGERHRLFEASTVKVELHDRSGETGYILDLEEYGCVRDGIYRILIDVPNDRTNRLWQFALVKGFQYQFEDAPYVFRTRGTIRFPGWFHLRSLQPEVRKNPDDNSFNFAITPNNDTLDFLYVADETKLSLQFEVPALRWKFDEGPWQVEQPGELWHTEIPRKITLRVPSRDVSFILEEPNPEDEELEHRIKARPAAEKNTLEIDMTRVQSWLGGDHPFRFCYLEFGGTRFDFFKIMTRSVAVSCMLQADFVEQLLHGEVVIVGKANYFVDVLKAGNGQPLAENISLEDGKFTIPYYEGSARLSVVVYEEEEDDDSGFGLTSREKIGTFERNVTNPYDLTGKTAEVRCVKKGIDSIFRMSFSCRYEIRALARKPGCRGHIYVGKLVVPETRCPPIRVTVEFPDLKRLRFAYLQFFDGLDDVAFLYDHQRKWLVTDELPGLTSAVKYRRYECLFPEEYVYELEF